MTATDAVIETPKERPLAWLKRHPTIAIGIGILVLLALMAVFAPWLAGDPLPLQRRMALGGPGTLPGYGFRETSMSPDLLNCSSVSNIRGSPGFCDRIAMAQVELRSRLFSGIFRDDGDDDWWRPGFNHEAQWVLFADFGRGWNVGTSDGGVIAGKGSLPDLSSFKRYSPSNLC